MEFLVQVSDEKRNEVERIHEKGANFVADLDASAGQLLLNHMQGMISTTVGSTGPVEDSKGEGAGHHSTDAAAAKEAARDAALHGKRKQSEFEEGATQA